MDAAHNGHADMVAALLKAGAKPNVGLTAGPFGVVSSRSPLLFAAHNGHADTVAAPLKAGADPNVGGTFGPIGWSMPSSTDAATQKMLEDAQTRHAAGRTSKSDL